MQLKKHLIRWQEAGLLTAEQVKAIVDHEAGRNGFWSSWGFTVLGVLAIALGIIALVASNWAALGMETKLGLDALGFVLLSGLALKVRGNALAFEAVLLLFAGYVLASIGLIGQLFHLSGPMHGTLLFWCALTFPVVIFSKKGLAPWLWTAALTYVVYGFLGEWGGDDSLKEMIALSIPAAQLLAAAVLRAWQPGRLFGNACAWQGWLGLVMVWLVAPYMSLLDDHNLTTHAVLPGLMYGLLMVAAAVSKKPLQERFYLTVATGIFWLMMFNGLMGGVSALSHLLALGAVMAAALYAATAGHEKLFHTFTILAALKLVWLYIDLLGSLAVTGFGLISTGVLILILVSLWKKKKILWKKVADHA